MLKWAIWKAMPFQLFVATQVRSYKSDIINLCEDTSENTTARVAISGLTHRTDKPSMGDKVTEANRIIKSFVSGRDLRFNDNSKIRSSMLNRSGLHLNQKGSAALAKNILNRISIDLDLE